MALVSTESSTSSRLKSQQLQTIPRLLQTMEIPQRLRSHSAGRATPCWYQLSLDCCKCFKSKQQMFNSVKQECNVDKLWRQGQFRALQQMCYQTGHSRLPVIPVGRDRNAGSKRARYTSSYFDDESGLHIPSPGVKPIASTPIATQTP